MVTPNAENDVPTVADVVRAIEDLLDDADQVTDTLENPNLITIWGVRRALAPFGGKPHRFPVPAERCEECGHLSWNHYDPDDSLDGCAECDCLLSRREAHWGRDEEMDESIRQALYEDALVEGYDPEPTRPIPPEGSTDG